jgi:hypothetical protein
VGAVDLAKMMTRGAPCQPFLPQRVQVQHCNVRHAAGRDKKQEQGGQHRAAHRLRTVISLTPPDAAAFAAPCRASGLKKSRLLDTANLRKACKGGQRDLRSECRNAARPWHCRDLFNGEVAS